MSLGTREIKRRIKSVANTKKITKAMELVAAAKMRKAVDGVLSTRDYSRAAWNIVKDLSAKTDPKFHSLLATRREIKRIGLILISSNRGLCGGFNREIVEIAAKYLKAQIEKNKDLSVEVLLMGKRGSDIWHKYGYKVVAEFQKSDVAESIAEISPCAKMATSDFISGKYDRVVIAYTDYHSAIRQSARLRQLLPVSGEDTELGYVSEDKSGREEKQEDFEYLFEPSPDIVLDKMLYRLIELQIYQALLESNASEHSARMLAMRNASDAAADMIDDLTLTFNQARQQAITSELADISAGSAAIQ